MNLLNYTMDLQWSNLAILPLISIALALLNAYSAYKSISNKEGKIFLLFSSCIFLISFGYLFEILSENEAWILFWDNFQFLGADLLLFFGFYFSLLILRKYNGINRYLLKLLGIVLLSNEFLLWTFPLNDFIRDNIHFSESYEKLLIYDFGTFQNFYNLTILSYILYALILMLLQSRKEYSFRKKQLLIFSLALSFPFLGGIISVIGIIPFIDPHFDLSPIYLSLSNIVWIYGINFHQILKVLPFAREKIFENMKDASVILYRNNLILDANEAFANIINTLPYSLKNTELKVKFPELYHLIISKSTSHIINEWIFTVNGYNFYYEIIIHKLYHINPYIKFIEMRDITFNKNLQLSLQHQMNFLNSIFTSTSHLFIVLNSLGEILLFNPACERTFQVDISDIVNKVFWEVFPNSNFPGKTKQNLREILNEHDKYPLSLLGEWTLKNDEKVIIEWEINLNFEKNKTISSYIFTGKEISFNIKATTKILNLENALEEINIQKNLIESQKNEIEVTLENLKTTQKQLVQSEKMAALGQLITGIAHEINNPIGAINACIYNLKSELDLLEDSYSKVYKMQSYMNKEQIEIFKNFKSIIESEDYPKEKLNDRQKRKIIKDFFVTNSISNLDLIDKLVDLNLYNLNSSYTNFLNFNGIHELLEHLSLEKSIKTNFIVIQLAIEKVSKLLYALKNYSHIGNQNSGTYTSLSNNLETVLMIYKSNLKDIQLIRNYSLTKEIFCYPEDLIQVWTNIIYNALQAMKFKGTIQINTYEFEDNAIVEIIDNGPGINPDYLEKIFLPFFTTKDMGEGTGIGLDITKRIIEKHNGKIEVDSVPGRTCFKITLPLNENKNN